MADATFSRIAELSAALDLRVHVHLHETAGEVDSSRAGVPGATRHLSDTQVSPLDNLNRLGLLNHRLVAVHMTQLADADIARLAAARANVVHCPASNLKLASGFCPVAKLVAAGVNVALGTDSAASNNGLDFWAEIKLAALLAKGVAGDATALPAWQALRMATLNGAVALGIDDVTGACTRHARSAAPPHPTARVCARVSATLLFACPPSSPHAGSLEVGKAADMCAVDLGAIETQPLYSVISHLVYATSRSSVTDVWVDGQQLLEDRRLTTIDLPAVMADVVKWGAKIRDGKVVAPDAAAAAPSPAESTPHKPAADSATSPAAGGAAATATPA